MPDVLGALASAPPAVIQLLTDPKTTSAEKESWYLESLHGSADDGLSSQVRLALYKLGMAENPWLAPGLSYCSWYAKLYQDPQNPILIRTI